MDFGFEREKACLALKLKNNDVEEAVEVLTSDIGNDLNKLYELVQAKIEAEDDLKVEKTKRFMNK